MTDWRDGQLHYLVHFGDGGTGRRFRDQPLDVGDELDDGGSRYRVVRVERPAHEHALGHAWVELRESG